MRKVIKYYSIFILLCLGGFFLNTFACCGQKSTNIYLGIHYAFEGVLEFVDNYYYDGSIFYTSEQDHLVSIMATDDTNYTIQGDLAFSLTSSGSSNISEQQLISLTAGQGLKSLHAEFLNNQSQYVKTDNLKIYYDISPPTIPTIVGPVFGENLGTEGVLFKWVSSNDNESGISYYRIVISEDPTMLNPQIFNTQQTSLLVNSNLLSQGDLYRYVEAIDNVGNSSQSLPSFFSYNYVRGSGSNTLDNENTVVINNTIYEKDESDNNNELPKNDNDIVDQELIEGLTYYFQGIDNEQSIIEIIKANNRLNILVNQAYDSSSIKSILNNEHGTEELYTNNENSNIIAGFTLPSYLQNTGASYSDLINHLTLIQKFFPNKEVQLEMKLLISHLLPKWYAGFAFIILLLCYDIESYKRRYTILLGNLTKS